MEKLQIEVNKGMAMVAEMVKMKAFSEASGKAQAWWSSKMNHTLRKGKVSSFEEVDLPYLNDAIEKLGNQLSDFQIDYSKGRESIICQIRELDKIVSMPYIYNNVLGKGRSWFKNRMPRDPLAGKAYYFSEEDILKINIAVIDIANRLKNIELVM